MRFALVLTTAALAAAQERPFHRAGLIFPLEHWHNHASSVVELPNGDLFAVWYHGSGERTADDVVIEASRLRRGRTQWDPRFTVADTPGFPDCNPALLLDSKKRLWLTWPVILANEWHTALARYLVSTDYLDASRPPRWEVSENMLFVPRNFTVKAREAIGPWLAAAEAGSQRQAYLKRLYDNAGDKYFSRMGWMPRAHPVELPSGRIIVPLYSDGYDFSLMAITDDGGRTWSTSEPVVSAGGVQPTIARKKDGTLVAYMRDNGPPPKRVLVTSSIDDGVTWTAVTDTDIPNPGSGLEVINLRDGSWAMIFNDTERGRHSLVAAISDDEGTSWKWRRRLEHDDRRQGAASYHYPSLIQARDGTLHATYSYFLNHLPPGAARKSIKHAHFNIAWVKHGDPAP